MKEKISKPNKIPCRVILTAGSNEKIAKWAAELYKNVNKKDKLFLNTRNCL